MNASSSPRKKCVQEPPDPRVDRLREIIERQLDELRDLLDGVADWLTRYAAVDGLGATQLACKLATIQYDLESLFQSQPSLGLSNEQVREREQRHKYWESHANDPPPKPAA